MPIFAVPPRDSEVPRTFRQIGAEDGPTTIHFGNALKSTPEGGRSDDRPGGGEDNDDGGVHTAAGHHDLMLFTPSGLLQCTLEIGSDRCQRFLKQDTDMLSDSLQPARD